MLKNDQQNRSPSPTLDPAAHIECLEFIRQAIAAADHQTALDIKNVVAEVCNNGYADRVAVWQSLSADEQSVFTALLKEPEPIALDCGF